MSDDPSLTEFPFPFLFVGYMHQHAMGHAQCRIIVITHPAAARLGACMYCSGAKRRQFLRSAPVCLPVDIDIGYLSIVCIVDIFA
jgi:hypothetical protein